MERTLEVNQIQGTRYREENGTQVLPEGIRLFDGWDLTLLRIATVYSINLGLETIGVRSAEAHLHYGNPVEVPPERMDAHQERMRSRYDKNAEKLGFKWDPRLELYVRSLK